MKSGISASQELLSDFNTLLSSDQHFGLLATIKTETLQPLQFLTPSAASRSTSFGDKVTSLLAPHLKPDGALYILLRRHTSVPYLTAVTYIPDTAPVRQKMLFAATRLALVRELGTEHFRETIFATTVEELSARGFEKHDVHAQLEAPLTEEEKSLEEVKRAEQEAGSGMGARELHLSKSLKMPVEETALRKLKELGRGEGRGVVMLKINSDTETVELVSDTSSPSSIPGLVQAISSTEPRFTFYRFEHLHARQNSNPVLFFYTCPATPGNRAIKNRMLYPLMKRAVLEIACKEAGLQVEKKFEVEDPSEITEELVIGELHPKVEVRQGFSRPKRPGR